MQLSKSFLILSSVFVVVIFGAKNNVQGEALIEALPTEVTQPRWPGHALMKGIEGWVKFKFNTDRYGKVIIHTVDILSEEPENIFSRGARRDIRKLVFGANKYQEELTYTMVYKLETDIVASPNQKSVNKVLIGETEKSSTNRKLKKGPYGSNGKNFGFGEFFMGMNYDGSDGLVRNNGVREHFFNGLKFESYKPKNGLLCVLNRSQFEEQKSLKKQLQQYGKLDEYLNEYDKIKTSFDHLIVTKLNAKNDGELQIHIVDGKVVELEMVKEYSKTGLSPQEFSKKIKSIFGRTIDTYISRDKKRLKMTFEGKSIKNDSCRNCVGKEYSAVSKLISWYNYKLKQDYLGVLIDQHKETLKVYYRAIDFDGYHDASIKINDACFQKSMKLGMEMLKKAQSQKVDFEL